MVIALSTVRYGLTRICRPEVVFAWIIPFQVQVFWTTALFFTRFRHFTLSAVKSSAMLRLDPFNFRRFWITQLRTFLSLNRTMTVGSCCCLVGVCGWQGMMWAMAMSLSFTSRLRFLLNRFSAATLQSVQGSTLNPWIRRFSRRPYCSASFAARLASMDCCRIFSRMHRNHENN